MTALEIVYDLLTTVKEIDVSTQEGKDDVMSQVEMLIDKACKLTTEEEIVLLATVMPAINKLVDHHLHVRYDIPLNGKGYES